MNKSIMVFGSFVTDLTARCGAFPTPGQTVKGESFRTGPGGKGSNQAVAAHMAGAKVRFVTRIGDDAFGREAMNFYESIGMNTEKVLVAAGESTGAALIMVNAATAQNEIVVCGGACCAFSQEETEALFPVIDACDIFLTQFETNLLPVYTLLKYAHEKGKLTVVDPAPACKVDAFIWPYVDIVKPNETEAEFYTGVSVHTFADAARAADVFQSMGVRNVIITLGEKGAFMRSKTGDVLIPPVNAGAVVDTTGAGDAFSGGFVAALAEDMGIAEAVRFASAMAGLCITREGTAPAMPSRQDIERLLL